MAALVAALALVAGAVLLLLAEVLWPGLVLYLTGFRVGYRLSESEYDMVIVAQVLNALGGGIDGDRLSAEQRRILQQCIDELEEVRP